MKGALSTGEEVTVALGLADVGLEDASAAEHAWLMGTVHAIDDHGTVLVYPHESATPAAVAETVRRYVLAST